MEVVNCLGNRKKIKNYTKYCSTPKEGNGSVHRLPISYVDVTIGNGEFHDTFYSNHSPEKLGIQYSVKNKGTQQFSWKMIDSDGKLWVQGTLAAGKAHTAILEKGSYTMPEGMYSMSIITIDGAEGMFDFVVKLVE